MRNADVYNSSSAVEAIEHAKVLLNSLLVGTPAYSRETVDAIVELIVAAAVLESNANVRYVLNTDPIPPTIF